jgi:alkylhydroperoxidase/carboxymuconolactone decarboxylase family protein
VTRTDPRSFLAEATRRDVLVRSGRVALVVGTLLAAINHGNTFLAGELGVDDLVKIAVSYLVPFGVATWSAVAQARRRGPRGPVTAAAASGHDPGGPMSDYYKHEHLVGFADVSEASPALGRKFFEWYGAVFADGALTEREKALVALGVAHAVQCPYCIDAYTQGCLEKGADLEQMTEVMHVAAAIRGGASLVHGMQMRDVAKRRGM